MAQVGEVRAHRHLGTMSVYRALAVQGGHVEVEVIRAPGLSAGVRIRLTVQAFAAMAPIGTVVAEGLSVDDELAALARRVA
jgi:hypothetical protein